MQTHTMKILEAALRVDASETTTKRALRARDRRTLAERLDHAL
jgi:hypothetical protein